MKRAIGIAVVKLILCSDETSKAEGVTLGKSGDRHHGRHAQ